MASRVTRKDLAPTLAAAREWIERCLIDDGSVLTDKRLWTAALVREMKRAFVDNPQHGSDSFMDKLRGQLNSVSTLARQLAAEMIWSLLLFPSNINPDTKRGHVQETWEPSGEQLRPRGQTFDDEVLKGIGSGGTGYNNNRPKELAFLIAVADSLKQRTIVERRHILTDYDAFLDWIDTVPSEGRRQFPRMLRYLAFPDRVERMSSNRDRREVLAKFDVAPTKETRKWSDRQLDDAMLALRRKLEHEHPGAILDFYEPPLVEKWRSSSDDQPTGPGEPVDPPVDVRPSGAGGAPVVVNSAVPRNLILYGPPGTGKTYWLRAQCEEYTDRPEQVDRDTWLLELVSNYRWRPVIAAALADARAEKKVPELSEHPIIKAKAKQRGRPVSISSTLWSYLQEHTPESVTTVRFATRRPPFVFSKRLSGEWELLPEWRQEDVEAAALFDAYQRGPAGASQPVHRFRVVTFHPSFGYEDFIRGIRPVVTSEDGATQFRVVDGVFKRIADEARANPAKRYALFIDEINRANIAKVFGELITLIEVDKRITIGQDGGVLSGMEVDLPGSQDDDTGGVKFGVPANLDIYGTMNTADRSIAMLDVALRRRFEFKEMEPQPDLLGQVVDGVEVSRVLRRINDRLEYLLDRDHRIGHAYLMKATSLDDLRRAFASQIIPLLQEYFFDDLGRVPAVLTTAAGATPFVAAQTLRAGELFPKRLLDDAPLERVRYVVTPSAGWTADSFRSLYLDVTQLHGTPAQT